MRNGLTGVCALSGWAEDASAAAAEIRVKVDRFIGEPFVGEASARTNPRGAR